MELPLRPPSASGQALALALPFVLTAGDGHSILRQGKSTLADLPAASQLMLVVPACDVLLLKLKLPAPLSSSRLQNALPNLLEEQLLVAVEDCHFAVGVYQAATGVLPVAVIQRLWLREILDVIQTDHFDQVTVLPAQYLQAPASLQILTPSAIEGSSTVLSWREDEFGGAGYAVNTLQNLWLPTPINQLPMPEAVPFATAVSRFQAPFIDLCQFELARQQSWGKRLGTWKRAVGMLVLVLLAQVLFANLNWGLMAWQKSRIEGELYTLMKQALPNAPANADPLSTVSRALEKQRLQAGGAMPGEFPGLAAHLSLLMKGEPGDAITHVEYDQKSLLVRFKMGYPAMTLVRKANSLPGVSLKDMGQGLWKFSWEGH